MTQLSEISQDLRVIREAVTRRERRNPILPTIAWIWAVYVLVGYTLLDLRPDAGALFLLAGGILGGVASWFVGARAARRQGQLDRSEGRRGALHFGSILPAAVAVALLGVSRGLSGNTIGQHIALVVGIIYFLAGVHFDRNFLWLGALLMAGAIAVGYVPRYGWTALGILVAAGLVVPTLFRGGEAEHRAGDAAHA